MLAELIDEDEWADQVAYLTMLTKSADVSISEPATDRLAELNRLAAAGLLKVGPKGYIHGWLKVGPGTVGERVHHPEHGHGTVSRVGSKTSGVNFDSGHYAAFEHKPHEPGSGHFAERTKAPRKAPAPKPASKKPAAAAKPTAERDHIDETARRMDEAHRALNEGRHADAVNHLTAAGDHAERAGSPTHAARIRGQRNELAGRLMGKPAKPKTPRKTAAPKPARLTAEETVARLLAAKDRHEGDQIIAGHKKAELTAALDHAGIHYRKDWNKAQLQQTLVQWTVGRRSDSDVISRPRSPEERIAAMYGKPNARTVKPPAASAPPPLLELRRANNIPHPNDSGISDTIARADSRLKRGESPADVAASLRDAAARHAAAGQEPHSEDTPEINSNRQDMRTLRKAGRRPFGSTIGGAVPPALEIDEDEYAERVNYLTLLTKSTDWATRERAIDHLAELNRLVTAGLVKVGPKGYIHGWIHVGPQTAGARVFHPEHGHGTVTRSGKRTVGVRFDSGKEHAFEHTPSRGRPGTASGHYAPRLGERTGKPSKPRAEKPAAAASPQVHQHLDNAHTAVREGRDADAADHMAAAVAASHSDKDVQRKIKEMRGDLAGRKPSTKKPKAHADADRAARAADDQARRDKTAREKYAKELVLRMAAGEKFDVDQEHVPDLMHALDGADPVNLSLVQLKGKGNENLFQFHMRDIPRDQMPALPDNVHDLRPFIEELQSRGVKAELVELDPRSIVATQSQLSGPKVAKMAGFMKSGWKPGGALIVSKEGEHALLDGHHRWAGAAVASIQHEMGVPDTKPVKVTALRVDLPIDELLKVGEMYSGPKKSLGEAP